MKSNFKYKNRYNDIYWWEQNSDSQYSFHMDGESMKWCRCAGYPGGGSDLSMFDPSGGPYIGLGEVIDGRAIKRIWNEAGTFRVEVE